MSRIPALLDQLRTAKSHDDLQRVIADFRDSSGLEHAIYHVVGTTGREFGAHTYDPGWVEHYIENQYFHIDPVVLTSLRSFGPVHWSELNWSPPSARALIGEAVAEGVGKQGLTMPVRGVNGQFALFSVTSYDDEAHWNTFTQENANDLLLLSHYLHEAANRITTGDQIGNAADLSPRERDVITHLAVGRSRADIAARLKISEHTIRAYIDTARIKLGATNTTHAVAMALSKGLILP